MDFSLTEEQKAVQETVRAFSREKIMPHARDWDVQGSFPRELIREMGELGFLGVPIPEAYGGSGMDYVAEAIVFEEVGYADSSVRTTLSVQMSLVELTILAWGTEEQKQYFLPKLCSGEWIGCFGLTEPEAGSDASNQQTVARKEGDEWVLNGQKVWISNGEWADVAIVFAQTEPGSRHRGMVAFLIETDRPGFEARTMHGKLGLRASNTGELFFTDMRVKDSERLCEIGEGFKVAMSALDNGRMGVASGCVGIAQHALDASVAYAQERETFDKPIANYQLVQALLADMHVETEAARMLVYKAAWVKNQGDKSTIPVSVAKYYSSEVAKRAADMAIQIHGGYGYSNEYAPERLWRDGRVASLYEGTSQIQQLIIGRHLTGVSAFE
ncbi:MAG: acyl-CoA dehydrogenase family protein [Anaerolineales bacterium]|nr:acyl-CoA dehydrogenase family protein [Anaerolineales bacterium]MCB9126670.1 acyl-CoA dehydrogenase family protein [Ardenticatenales bacterium]MCB9171790.1 acyl-CoA dehydrogenase family protein [Ardenticatenales bacterium]